MKKIIGSLITAVGISLAGVAHADLMDVTYDNTVNIGVGDRVIVSYYFNEDGTVTLLGMDGSSADGHWTLDGTTLCVTVEDQSSCNEIAEREVGDEWTEVAEDGNTITVSVTEGR